MKRIKTGIDSLDKILDGGIAENSVCLICGRPGMGKTLVASEIAVSMAKTGTRVLYIDLEMSPATMCYFLNEASNDDMVDENLEYHALTYKTGVGGIVMAIVESKADVVFVDYVDLIDGTGNGTLEFATKGLFDKTFVWCCQLKRDIDERDDKTPTLKDSYGIMCPFCYADNTILLFRDSYYAESGESEKNKTISLNVYDGEEYKGKRTLPFDTERHFDAFYRAVEMNGEKEGF